MKKLNLRKLKKNKKASKDHVYVHSICRAWYV